MRKTVTSRLGQRMKDRETLIGSSPRAARKQGILMRPRATAANRASETFADGSQLAVDAVVWATGYRLDHALVELPVFDDRGQPRHRRGVTDVPGLYFRGLPWQHTRGSALLGWVNDDAEFIAQRIARVARPTSDAARRRHRCFPGREHDVPGHVAAVIGAGGRCCSRVGAVAAVAEADLRQPWETSAAGRAATRVRRHRRLHRADRGSRRRASRGAGRRLLRRGQRGAAGIRRDTREVHR